MHRKSQATPKSIQLKCCGTLESGIDVGQEINISLIHLLIQTQLVGFLNSFLEDYLVRNL